MRSAIILQSAERIASAKEYTGNGSSRSPVLVPRAAGDYLLTVINRERCNPPNRITYPTRTNS